MSEDGLMLFALCAVAFCVAYLSAPRVPMWLDRMAAAADWLTPPFMVRLWNLIAHDWRPARRPGSAVRRHVDE